MQHQACCTTFGVSDDSPENDKARAAGWTIGGTLILSNHGSCTCRREKCRRVTAAGLVIDGVEYDLVPRKAKI